MPRNPQYGVEKTADELSAQDPCAILYGVTPDNKFIPVKIDNQGRIQLGSGVTLAVDDLDLGDVGIVGIDPTTSLEHELSITNLGVDGWGLKTSLYDSVGTGITSTSIGGGKQGLDVNVIGATLTVSLNHTTDNILVYGNDGVNDQKLKTNSSGELQVGITNTPLTVTQSGLWSIRLQDGSGNTISSTSNALDVNIKGDTHGASSSSVTSLARSNVNQTFLVANTSRKGVTLYNDSGTLLYVKLGTTSSTTDFTVRMSSQSYYEVPFGYTGRIDGIWATGGAGDVRITELL